MQCFCFSFFEMFCINLCKSLWSPMKGLCAWKMKHVGLHIHCTSAHIPRLHLLSVSTSVWVLCWYSVEELTAYASLLPLCMRCLGFAVGCDQLGSKPGIPFFFVFKSYTRSWLWDRVFLCCWLQRAFWMQSVQKNLPHYKASTYCLNCNFLACFRVV